MSFRDEVLRDILDERELCIKWGLGIGRQPDTIGYTEDVRIYRHRRAIEDDRGDDIGRLAPDTRELHQLFALFGDFALVVSDETLCHRDQVTCLSARITDTAHELEDVVYFGTCHYFCGGIFTEETRGDHIHSLVRALSREDYGYKKFEGSGIVELRLSDGHMLLKPPDDSFVSLLTRHAV